MNEEFKNLKNHEWKKGRNKTWMKKGRTIFRSKGFVAKKFTVPQLGQKMQKKVMSFTEIHRKFR